MLTGKIRTYLATDNFWYCRMLGGGPAGVVFTVTIPICVELNKNLYIMDTLNEFGAML